MPLTTPTRLSIGVPIYNGERFLPRLIESLAAQTFHDYEIVISDNASTDGTEAICRAWAGRDARVRYHCNATNIGASGNFNKVFTLCEAPLFKWAACDDTYAPTYLEACIRILDAHPEVVVAQTDVVCIDADGAPFKRDDATGTFIIPGTALSYATDPTDIGETGSAVRRYRDVLFRCRSNAQIFGVIRRDALAATSLLPNFLGAEKATVLELALIGRFQQDRAALFNRCYHPDITEVKQGESGRRYIAPADRNYLRATRMLRTFLATPLGKDIPLHEKLACFGLLAARGAQFSARAASGRQAKDWPFLAAWGTPRNRRRTAL